MELGEDVLDLKLDDRELVLQYLDGRRGGMMEYRSFETCVEFSLLPRESLTKPGRLGERRRRDGFDRCEERAGVEGGVIE